MYKIAFISVIFSLVFNYYHALNVDHKQLDWWQRAVFYQIYPRSFKDSDGDGIGDLKGIAEKIWYLKDLGITGVWFNPVLESPGLDLGYDISNFTNLDPLFGTMEDFQYLREALYKAGIHLFLDIVPNHTSDQHDWFLKSVKKIDPYTNYYIWKDPKIVNGQRQPPTNWLSEFGGSTWKWHEERNQYYLHQFHWKQPDLNYDCEELVQEMMDVVRFWLERGVDGMRFDAVAYLFEDPEWRDQELLSPDLDPTNYWNYNRSRTMDQPNTYRLITRFREVFDFYTKKEGKTKVLMTEAYTTLDRTMDYYQFEGKPGAHMPFNFFFITHVSGRSPAKDYQKAIQGWMDSMPAGFWPNWVMGNHDNRRVAARYGSDLVDGVNMIGLCLPGIGNTYYGDEIGMDDTVIRFDQGVDPQACHGGPEWYSQKSRDPARTPFQWDTSLNSGFTTNRKTWLPVNSNFWRLNLKAQMQAGENSHWKVYKRLMSVRKTDTILYGDLETFVLTKYVFAFVRRLEGSEAYVVVVNLGSDSQSIDLLAFMSDLPDVLTVHTSSVNSQYLPNDKVSTNGFFLRPKASVLLTTAKEVPPPAYTDPANGSSTIHTVYFSFIITLFIYVFFS
nr:PREDICTED: maltase 2-like [Bemisia tabaci]